jgi:hypothetical protein
LQCYSNFPSWTPSQYNNYLHLFDLEIVPIDWWKKHLDNIEMHLNKHEKGIKNTTIHIHCTLFNILYYDHKIDKNKYKNENRSVQSITLVFHVQFFFCWHLNSEKIHILAAPQYKPRADFHKKKVAAYFPIFSVTEILLNVALNTITLTLYYKLDQSRQGFNSCHVVYFACTSCHENLASIVYSPSECFPVTS